MRVLITHPGRQHSHQAALALARSGMLAGYWSGVPALARHRRGVPGPLWRRFVRYDAVDMSAELVGWAPWVPALRRLGDGLLPRRLAAHTDLLACRLFDRWAAARLSRRAAGDPETPDAVVACEISALETFRRARRLGVATILDAAALHHRTQDRLHGFAEPAALHRRIAAIKDEEIALADHVLTVSELAQRSYVEAGVAPERVHRLPLGADLALFAPPAEESAPRDGEGVTFVFAGAASRIKGFDLLLEAFARVRAEEPNARLWTIGSPGDGLASQAGAGVEKLGSLPQAEVAARFRRADCLVLPSRGESFGMVVPEALAAGLPVVVSAGVGAAELVREGVNGWVVPAGDAAALARRMLWCARHREELIRMRAACRASASAADWSSYRERLPALLREILGERARPVSAPTAVAATITAAGR